MDMQGADRINDEFEVGFNAAFERSWARAEWVGRIVMVVFIAATLAGLLGRGPYSHDTVKSDASGLAIDFEPIARSQAPTQVTFHLSNPTDDPAMTLFISTNVIEPMGLHSILPQPIAAKPVQNGLLLTFDVPPGTKDSMVRLQLEPNTIGDNQLAARLEGHQTIKWDQYVVP
jgi:hypothetical protein